MGSGAARSEERKGSRSRPGDRFWGRLRGPGKKDPAIAAGLPPEAILGERAAEASAAEDREWIERARFADEAAFASLVTKYQERAIAIARHFVQNDEAARDVAQEAFLRVHRNLHRYDPRRRFYTWFYRIVVHLAIDGTRRSGRILELLRQRAREPRSTPSGPDARLELEDLRGQVERVLSTLPEKYRQLLLLRDAEGFTSKEISEISGSNHATVRWRLHRARSLFRDAWAAAGYEPFARGSGGE
jgi:RNA polymerase sigma-70 factor (ECF subfamily)